MVTTDRWLMVSEMAALSGFSKSFFYTNKCLAKHGHKAATLPPMVAIGRSLRCKASHFEKWLEGPTGEDATPPEAGYAA